MPLSPLHAYELRRVVGFLVPPMRSPPKVCLSAISRARFLEKLEEFLRKAYAVIYDTNVANGTFDSNDAAPPARPQPTMATTPGRPQAVIRGPQPLRPVQRIPDAPLTNVVAPLVAEPLPLPFGDGSWAALRELGMISNGINLPLQGAAAPPSPPPPPPSDRPAPAPSADEATADSSSSSIELVSVSNSRLHKHTAASRMNPPPRAYAPYSVDRANSQEWRFFQLAAAEMARRRECEDSQRSQTDVDSDSDSDFELIPSGPAPSRPTPGSSSVAARESTPARTSRRPHRLVSTAVLSDDSSSSPPLSPTKRDNVAVREASMADDIVYIDLVSD